MNVLTMFVIYQNPLDYPGKFVVRRQDAQLVNGQPTLVIAPHALCITETLAEAREVINHWPGLVCLARDPSDEPQIVESWI